MTLSSRGNEYESVHSTIDISLGTEVIAIDGKWVLLQHNFSRKTKDHYSMYNLDRQVY
jgi:hypothetical protein